ncbi:hypothetical protein [Microcoleus sp. herbarium5]|uniref:hypothetical protein n=1 Tax=Microcoleus sp. herbarium5 TaxID=3055434 RepID=UPI002FD17F03
MNADIIYFCKKSNDWRSPINNSGLLSQNHQVYSENFWQQNHQVGSEDFCPELGKY